MAFLNIPQLERQGADLQTKIEELQEINQSLREKDKMKEDVISNLSDKLMMLSERLDAVEKIELVIMEILQDLKETCFNCYIFIGYFIFHNN